MPSEHIAVSDPAVKWLVSLQPRVKRLLACYVRWSRRLDCPSGFESLLLLGCSSPAKPCSNREDTVLTIASATAIDFRLLFSSAALVAAATCMFPHKCCVAALSRDCQQPQNPLLSRSLDCPGYSGYQCKCGFTTSRAVALHRHLELNKGTRRLCRSCM